jgi:hypothetical protein
MSWLEDKKNLPFVIAGAAVLILAAGFMLYRQISGPYIPPAPPQAAAPAPAPEPSPATPPAAAPPAATPAAAPAPTGPPMATGMKPPSAPTGAPAASGTSSGAKAGQPGTGKPQPMLVWRPDPFALDIKPGRHNAAPVHRLLVPMPTRVFEPTPVPIEVHFPQVQPEPVRRVAGIMIGDRVRALIQTPDGWEMVKAGDPLKDGSIVERIERDRVFIRQVPATPTGKYRTLVVRLAAEIPQTPSGASSVGGSPGRSSITFRRAGSSAPEGRAL